MPRAEESLCDVNVLVSLVHDAHEHSPVANAWLASIDRRRCVHVCRITQLGFLRLITSRRIFASYALQPGRAWAAFETLMSDERFAYSEEPKGLEPVFRELSASLQPGASVGTDVYLAAFAQTGRLELVSFDTGFRRFPDLRLRVLANGV